MEYKKAGAMWILYLTLFILFVVFFPKTCGKTDFVSEITDFNCQGIEAPFFKGRTNYSWCYGICIEKSIKSLEENNDNQNNTNTKDLADNVILGPFDGFKEALVKKGPILLGIIILAGILKWIGSLKARKSNFVVYKKM